MRCEIFATGRGGRRAGGGRAGRDDDAIVLLTPIAIELSISCVCGGK